MKRTHLHQNQRGLVSFLVVTMLMLVITLIVLSFSTIMRREQRQTLDRQLNTQAFYAAETGVNDAYDRLGNAGPASILFTKDYTRDCNEFITDAGLTTASDLGGGTSYSCVLVDTSPPQLKYSSVPAQQSVAVPVRPAPDSVGVIRPIISVEVSWEDANAADANTALGGCPAAGRFEAAWPASCELGMVRIELVPFNGATSRTNLTNVRSIAFVHPSNSGGSTGYTFSNSANTRQGLVTAATCSPATGRRRCTIRVTGIDAAVAGGMTNGYMRVRSIYRTHAVTVRAFSAAGQVDLMGAQAEVDVTGKASDVLKRIKVNAPIAVDDEDFPEYAVQTARSQCKRLELVPGTSIVSVSWFNALAANNPCNPYQTVLGD